MKILYINDFASYSGAESHLQTLSTALNQAGVETSLWFASEKRGPWQERLRWERPSIIHVHNFWQIPQKEWPELFHSSVSTVLSLHDYGVICPQRMRLFNSRRCPIPCHYECKREELVSSFQELLAGVALVTFNPGSQKIFAAQGAKDVRVIPHGIDLDIWPYAPLSGRRGIGFVQGDRSNWWKGFQTAEFIAHELGQPFLTARGGRPHADVIDVYQRCAVYLNPCVYDDTFGLTTIEALACGAPVVSYATAGARAILDQGRGLLVPIGDIGAMIESARAVLNTPPDTLAVWRQLKAEFTAERMAQNWKHLYQSL